MLESIMNPLTARKRPWEMMIIGVLYFSVGCILSLWVFQEYASIVTLLFTVMSIVPLIYHYIRIEEKMSTEEGTYLRKLISHAKYFSSFMWLFGGLVIGATLWYVFAPPQYVHTLFKVQLKTLMGLTITGKSTFVSGQASSLVGNVTQFQKFIVIFFNNIKVMIFCLLFSFVYGTGAIFILTWNASVVGTAIGHYVRIEIAKLSSYTGIKYFSYYFGILAIGLVKYTIHGIPEILAYFVAGLAGGLISVGIIKKDYLTNKFGKVVWDASNLMIIAIFILFAAALLEVYVTPLIFDTGL